LLPWHARCFRGASRCLEKEAKETIMHTTTTARALGFAGCILLLACGGSSSGGGTSSGSGSGSSGTCDDVNGTWTGSAQVDASACGEGSYTDTGSLVLTQSTGSCSVAVSYYSYGSMNGTVSGSTLTFSGSYPKFNGTVTLDNVQVSVSSDLTTIAGTVPWSYKGSTKTCSGTTKITGTKSGT
jgi:hypothetical protein